MIISCPHCQTKYQVTYEAIGSAGRKVQCAHCHQAWDQGPIDKDEPPPAVRKAEEAIVEDGLDDAMSAEEPIAAPKIVKGKSAKAIKAEQAAAAKAAKAAAAKAKKADAKANAARGQTAAGMIDPSVIRKRRKAFSRPEDKIVDEHPLARLRMALRIVGATALAGVLAYAYLGRVQVVQRFPAMAGVYEAVGLRINVVGLDFSDVTSLQTLRNGKEVLIVSAQIVGLSPNPVLVPAVVVTLIGPQGEGVYQWSVQPAVRDLMAGERSTFDTQLTLPPGAATRVRLSFAGSSGGGSRNVQPAAMSHAPAPAADHGAAPFSADAADHAAPAHPAAEVAAEHGAAAAPANASPEHH
ncbi:MAG: zinc-ribbon domain-containing protein [Devosia sp.]